MPTAKQNELRRERILRYTDEIGIDKAAGIVMLKADIKAKLVPAGTLEMVLTMALARNLIDVADIPPKMAGKVLFRFIKEASERERDDAADRGTEVHKLAERLGNGEKVTVPGDLWGHIASWRSFQRDFGMRFTETEFTVFSNKHRYGGCGDFMGFSDLHPEWGLILGDYKTSISGIWPDIALQLAALRYAEFIARCKTCPHEDNVHPIADLWEDHETLKRVKTCVGVQITADGYQLVPVRVTEGTFKVFLASGIVARWKTELENFALDKETYPFTPNAKES